MKKYLLALSLFCTTAFAAQALAPSEFINMFEDLETIEKAERVFSDELAQEDVYKVTFTYEEWECASAPTPSGDACGPNGKILTDCIYATVDTSTDEITPTDFTCNADLEDVIDIMAEDEL